MRPSLYIGMISGTSRDGVDAALAGLRATGQAKVVQRYGVDYWTVAESRYR